MLKSKTIHENINNIPPIGVMGPKINKGISTIEDNAISSYLNRYLESIHATTKKEIAYKDSDYVIVATPTNYDEKKQKPSKIGFKILEDGRKVRVSKLTDEVIDK